MFLQAITLTVLYILC